MKALVVTPKNSSELKFVTDLLKKLGVVSSTLNENELEDIGMSKMLLKVNKTKKASRSEILKKLTN